MKRYCPGWLQGENNRISNMTLEEINEMFSSQLFGIVVFIVLLVSVGIIGNTMCLSVFLSKFKPSNYRNYVLILTTIDFTACCTYMPGVLLFMIYPLTFTWNITCKMLYFIASFVLNLNHLVFLLIAIERYRLICHPLKIQTSKSFMKIGLTTSIVIALVLSTPRLVFMGTIRAQIEELNITTVSCFNNEEYDGKISSSVYEITVNLSTVLLSVVIIILYALVLRSTCTARRMSLKMRFGNRTQIRYTYKTTVTLLVMTFFFLLVYFPYRLLLIVVYIYGSSNCLLPNSGGFLVRLFMALLMINHSVNPFIYGVWDTRFRTELKRFCAGRPMHQWKNQMLC